MDPGFEAVLIGGIETVLRRLWIPREAAMASDVTDAEGRLAALLATDAFDVLDREHFELARRFLAPYDGYQLCSDGSDAGGKSALQQWLETPARVPARGRWGREPVRGSGGRAARRSQANSRAARVVEPPRSPRVRSLEVLDLDRLDLVGRREPPDTSVEVQLRLLGADDVLRLAEAVLLALEGRGRRRAGPCARSASTMISACSGGTITSSRPWSRITGQLIGRRRGGWASARGRRRAARDRDRPGCRGTRLELVRAAGGERLEVGEAEEAGAGA